MSSGVKWTWTVVGKRKLTSKKSGSLWEGLTDNILVYGKGSVRERAMPAVLE